MGTLELIVSAIDGHRYHYRQADAEIEPVVELLQHTKAFSQKNLVFHTKGSLVTFPVSAVARLDLVCFEPVCAYFPSTWRDAREICGAELQAERDAILQHRDEWERKREAGRFPIINSLYSLGGYVTHLLFEVVRAEGEERRNLTNSDIGMITQHALPPAYTIHRCDGGVSFINTANIVRMERIPGYSTPALNALTTHALEVIDLEIPQARAV